MKFVNGHGCELALDQVNRRKIIQYIAKRQKYFNKSTKNCRVHV